MKYFELDEEMEMPCKCDCGNWFDLNDGYSSNKDNSVVCESCHEKQEEIHLLEEEIEDVEDLIREAESLIESEKPRLEKLKESLSKLH